MPLIEPRPLFNELGYLLQRLDPAGLQQLAGAHPRFAAELQRGPDAGAQPVPDPREMAERARFTIDLAQGAAAAVQAAADRIITHAAGLARARLATAIIAAIGGASTLASLGLGQPQALKIAGIVTSLVAIANVVVERLSTRYSDAEVAKATELRKSATELLILRNDLQATLKYRPDAPDLARAIDACNALALQLNQRNDLLRAA